MNVQTLTVLAVALALVGLWVIGPVVPLAAIAAGLLVLYFNWRAQLRRRMLGEGHARCSSS